MLGPESTLWKYVDYIVPGLRKLDVSHVRRSVCAVLTPAGGNRHWSKYHDKLVPTMRTGSPKPWCGLHARVKATPHTDKRRERTGEQRASKARLSRGAQRPVSAHSVTFCSDFSDNPCYSKSYVMYSR